MRDELREDWQPMHKFGSYLDFSDKVISYIQSLQQMGDTSYSRDILPEILGQWWYALA